MIFQAAPGCHQPSVTSRFQGSDVLIAQTDFLADECALSPVLYLSLPALVLGINFLELSFRIDGTQEGNS